MSFAVSAMVAESPVFTVISSGSKLNDLAVISMAGAPAAVVAVEPLPPDEEPQAPRTAAATVTIVAASAAVPARIARPYEAGPVDAKPARAMNRPAVGVPA